MLDTMVNAVLDTMSNAYSRTEITVNSFLTMLVLDRHHLTALLPYMDFVNSHTRAHSVVCNTVHAS